MDIYWTPFWQNIANLLRKNILKKTTSKFCFEKKIHTCLKCEHWMIHECMCNINKRLRVNSKPLHNGAKIYLNTHSAFLLKTDWKRKFLYKWPLYDLFWPFFCHVCVYLSQKWGSDGHFELLNGSESWFGQKLWPQM